MNTNYIISVKEKLSGRDIFPPFVVPCLENMNEFIYKAIAAGYVVIIDKIDTFTVVPKNLFTNLVTGVYNGKEK